MTFDTCTSLSDVARVLNALASESLDVMAFQEALRRLGAIDTGDDVYWAIRHIGGGIVERLWMPGERFVVDEVDESDVPSVYGKSGEGQR